MIGWYGNINGMPSKVPPLQAAAKLFQSFELWKSCYTLPLLVFHSPFAVVASCDQQRIHSVNDKNGSDPRHPLRVRIIK